MGTDEISSQKKDSLNENDLNDVNEFSRLYTKNKLVDKELKELKVIKYLLIFVYLGKIRKFN